jgi:nucleoside-diphosphate-sugar epimerase
LKISILGAGPIPNNLAEALRGNFLVEIFSGQEITLNNIQVFKYKEFTSQIIDSDIVILAWRGLPSPESEKAEVLKYLVQNISSNAMIFNLSSVAVYGQNLGVNFETTVPKPINSYGHSKLDLENYLNTFAGSKVCNLRISNVFGAPGFNDILNRILDSALNAGIIELVSPTFVSRDFISIDTFIYVLERILFTSKALARREVINVSAGKSMNLCELMNLVEDLNVSKISYLEIPLSEDVIIQSFVSNVKIKALLNHEINEQSLKMRDFVRDQLGISNQLNYH